MCEEQCLRRITELEVALSAQRDRIVELEHRYQRQDGPVPTEMIVRTSLLPRRLQLLTKSPYYAICVVILLTLQRHVTQGFHAEVWYDKAQYANSVVFLLFLCGQYSDQYTNLRMTFFYSVIITCLINSI
jgi:hypothetical protein